jgi:hypothetical protein
MKELYKTQKLSIKQISDMLHVSKHIIKLRLIEHGLM